MWRHFLFSNRLRPDLHGGHKIKTDRDNAIVASRSEHALIHGNRQEIRKKTNGRDLRSIFSLGKFMLDTSASN